MQTVAMKPKRAEWTAIRIALVLLCAAMLIWPVLCVPLALIAPLLSCPLVGRKDEPLAWASAAMPVLASLIAGFDAVYAVSLLLIGLLPLLITRLIPLPKRPGALGMLLYISSAAVSLAVVLAAAGMMLGGSLQATLPQLAVDKISRMKNLDELLRRLVMSGLVSIPEGYKLDGTLNPLLQATLNHQMLLSLRLTLEILIAQELPTMFVNACVLSGLFTALRLERMNGVLLVVEAKTPNHKQTRVVAAPSFRLLTIPPKLQLGLLVMALVSFGFTASGHTLMQTVGQLCFATFETLFTLLGAAVMVFLYTKNDPERRMIAGVLAAAMYAVAPFVLLLIGLTDQRFHFRKPQAHKPD